MQDREAEETREDMRTEGRNNLINGIEHERLEKGGMMEGSDTEEEVEGRRSTWACVILYINKHFLFPFTFYFPRGVYLVLQGSDTKKGPGR